MDPEARFAELMRGPESRIALDDAAFCIAAAGQPGLDVDAQLARLDRLAEAAAAPSVPAIRELLFHRLGLTGAVEDYDDPRHSWLDQVLDRQVGLPIALAVLTMEVARRVDIDLVGVGMPGHFLVGDPSRPGRYLDVYRGGRDLDEDGCRAIHYEIFGDRMRWDPAFLDPTPPADIVARMLANLAGSYDARGAGDGRRWVGRLQAALPGRSLIERVQLARRLAELGAFDTAARLFEEVAAAGEEDLEERTTSRLRREAAALRALLN